MFIWKTFVARSSAKRIGTNQEQVKIVAGLVNTVKLRNAPKKVTATVTIKVNECQAGSMPKITMRACVHSLRLGCECEGS